MDRRKGEGREAGSLSFALGSKEEE